MKHIDLIKIVHSNREIIDKGYKQGYVENVSQELLDSTLFVKMSSKYKLNKNYLNFADSVLQRVDYSIIFGDYEKEYKELVKNKNRYIESPNEFYKKNIITLIENLYFKFYNRDREIQILLLRLENDTSLDIDVLIENAGDILEKVDELIIANEKIGTFFREDLRGVDEAIDILLQSISVDILKFIENIDGYIKQINQFIVQTKKRRMQNKQIIKLSNMILDEDTNYLEEHLTHNYKTLYHTVNKSQKNRVHIFADDKDIAKLAKELKSLLSDMDVKKPIKNSAIKPQAKEKLEIVDLDKLIKDLDTSKSEDIFLFIMLHPKLAKYKDRELINESFKLYLQIITEEDVVFEKSFNEYGIKVAKWV